MFWNRRARRAYFDLIGHPFNYVFLPIWGAFSVRELWHSSLQAYEA
jgi:hypothetical protein